MKSIVLGLFYRKYILRHLAIYYVIYKIVSRICFG